MAENFANAIKRSDLGDALIPNERSTEIIQTLPQQSVIANRAKRVTMSKAKKEQPVLASLPEAYWVAEGRSQQNHEDRVGGRDHQRRGTRGARPDSRLRGRGRRHRPRAAIRPLIAEAFGKKIDEAAIFGVDKPASWGTDILAGAKAAKNTVAAGTGADFAADVASLGQKIAEQGFAINGFASKAGLNWQLIGLRDTNGQPVYSPSIAEGQPSRLYGYDLNEVTNGAWDPTKAELLAADWSKFVYGVRQDMTFKIFDQGIISDADGKVIYNAMQQDSKIMRAWSCASDSRSPIP